MEKHEEFAAREKNVLIELFDKRGQLKKRLLLKNTVTTAGKNGIMDQILAAPTLGKPTHMAIGTGAPAANALGAEVGRVALDSKTRNNAVVTFVATFPAGTGTGAITEAGIFDAGAAGNAWMTAAFSVINKAAGDSLVITWTLTGA